MSTSATASLCAHCGNPLLAAGADSFCCTGCRTVHELLSGAGLLRYYQLRDAAITPPAANAAARRDQNWLEPLCARVAAAERPIELTIKLQGLRCAACVWLIQELFARKPGAQRVLVNSGRGSASLCVDARFPLSAFVAELEAFGYFAGAPGEPAADGGSELLLRTGVCLALGGNAMMFAAAIYLGLHDGPLYRVLHGLNFACASLAVLIGAPVFMRSAWQALRRGILHLDLPIAVGIALSYGAALWSFASGHAGAAYYDSLATFIALMLLGRWLKERIVLANQQQLLADDGVDSLLVRRVQAGAVQLVAARELRAGDELLVPPGDLVPVAAELLDTPAACSLDWINGESEPVTFARGSELPAGAFNAEASPLRVRAQTDFGASVLVELLGRRNAGELPATRRSNAFSIAYVSSVLFAAATAFAAWWLWSGNLTRALEVATAICVVTCPCAIGIAAPLAEDLVLAGLRRAGLFVRSASFLDRALAVRRIVFDKTGTLTTGRLHVA
ncbi:MAG TPA: heavy metal translocating P-type ATPase metal-binding domain-containing protein, partial [Polyangiales bacterium]|nr:heavy metal translocating P-type ATPase metal-binding domain-containing protein [Polyangiales bacterium]